MASLTRFSMLCASGGFLLGSAACIAWVATKMAIDADETYFEWPMILMVGLCTFTGTMAGALATFFHPRTKAPPTVDVSIDEVKPMPSRQPKRRKHPLARHVCEARITPAYHWQALSNALVRLLGDKKESLVGSSMFDRVYSEDRVLIEQAFVAAATDGRIQRVVARFTGAHAKGSAPTSTEPSIIYMRLDIWAKRKKGKTEWFDCRMIEITAAFSAKERQVQKLRQELARIKKQMRTVGRDLSRLKLSYRELYQHAPVMYFSTDRDGVLVTINDTLIRTLGYQRSELQGSNYLGLLATGRRDDPLVSSDAMVSREGGFETRWRKKDGGVLDVWLHTITVFDDAGRFVRYRGTAIDLTEKARLANELRARGDELERANHRLRTINSELEAFTHVVSHDLKEPLRTLQAYSHLLAEEHAAQLGVDGFQYINHLIRASRRLGTLIDELLNFSQAGRATRPPKVFNLIEIVATVRQDLVDLIQRKEAIVLTAGSLPDVIGDSVRITQLVTNLVANGLKYNQNPAPQVVVGAMENGDNPGRVTVYVRDNGIGIDPAFHSQIFGIFRRLHQGDEFEGTGAGLAICKKIVEGHGGQIWVESEKGNGATFYFTLPRSPFAATKPLTRLVENDRTTTNTRPPSAPSEGFNGRKQRIVLVEDQSDIALIIQKLGQRDGLAITWFPTAEDAWKHLQEGGADLLMFDLNLPGISGVELCQRIRTLPHLKSTPVAMFTPDQDANKLQNLRDAGANFFLTKDLLCQPTQWQEKIKELLGHAGGMVQR